MANFHPYLWSILAIVAILGVAMLLYWVWERQQLKKHMARAFADRPLLDPKAFYETYFRDKNVPLDVVVRIRAVLESELNVDLSQLAASDDFSKTLSFFWDFDSLAAVNIVMRLEEEFKIKIPDDEAAAMLTVNDIVEGVWRNLQSK